MTERPVLFNGAMVRAILAGTKTQTRRLVTASTSLVDGRGEGKAAWRDHLRFDGSEWVDRGPSPVGNAGPYLKVANADGERRHRICPRVQPGDLLWVRETWCRYPGDECRHDYRADNHDPMSLTWSPSIHMPREASRITLRVTSVRVERVQDISEEDARAEGVSYTGPYPHAVLAGVLPVSEDIARREFRSLWESINGEASWDANPWVWVVDFEVAS